MPLKAIIVVGHGKDCPYCGRVMSTHGKSDDPEFPTRDHVVARAAGGGGPRLIVCRKCNLDKKSMSLEDWQRKLAGCDDDRAPVVAAFIALMATGGHLKIIRKYERLADQAGRRDKSNGGKSVVQRARRAAKAASKRRAKRNTNRGGDGADPKSGDRLLPSQQDRTGQANVYRADEGRQEATEDQRHSSEVRQGGQQPLQLPSGD